jgi:hypothetical protein
MPSGAPVIDHGNIDSVDDARLAGLGCKETVGVFGFAGFQPRAAALFSLRLQLGLTRQPVRSKTVVVLLKFWLGLAFRYRLPRPQRVESSSSGLILNLFFGRTFRFDHLFSLSDPVQPALVAPGYLIVWFEPI